MSGFNFTDETRAVLARARDASADLGHEYIGTEHILLALLAQDRGVAHELLDRLGADRAAARALILQVVASGGAPGSTGPDQPYTTRSKRALELAAAEARELRHSFTDGVHLLIGLLREEAGVGGQVLVHSGVTLDRARTAMLRLLGNPSPPQERA